MIRPAGLCWSDVSGHQHRGSGGGTESRFGREQNILTQRGNWHRCSNYDLGRFDNWLQSGRIVWLANSGGRRACFDCDWGPGSRLAFVGVGIRSRDGRRHAVVV